jgi:hypothetical protein
MANNSHSEKKKENEANIAAVKAFRANHPINEIGTDYFDHKKKVYAALVQKTNAKYKEIARKQKAKRDLEKAMLRYAEQMKEKKINARMREDHDQ